MSDKIATEPELCCECGEPTGHAGKFNGSLYCDYCGAGPFCDACFQLVSLEHRCPKCANTID
jgi:hypothetical protein